MSIDDVRSGIRSELEATPEFFDFKVRNSSRDGKLWRVTVNSAAVYTDGGHANVVLDESFEGANVWWPGPPKGGGEVLTVIPEDEQIVLRHAAVAPPGNDGFIRLYPPR
jgi:DNA replication ATP-dependent helicase Dna2